MQEAAGSGAEAPDAQAPPLPAGPQTTRIDRWLWAVRLAKTRAQAAQACKGGHVRVNDQPVKPAATVHVGDEVTVKGQGATRIVTVTHILDKRVGAPIARRCYRDDSPPPPPRQPQPAALRRDPGAGRPTKRDRRAIEQLFQTRKR